MLRSRSRRHVGRAVPSLLLAGLVAATVTPLGGASPAPGPGNPWLQRRIAAAAHAGGEDENPQETLFAFGRAAEAGVPILDMDVQLSADDVPVVIHDDTVDRTTNGTGAVHSMTAAQLNALDAAYWYSADCAACHDRPASAYLYRGVRGGAVAPPAGYSAADFGVPTLEQVFERFGDAYFSIEIKDDAADVTLLARKTAELIDRYGLASRVVISSFGGPGMPAFRSAAPDVATSATLDEVQDFFLSNKVPTDAQVLDVPPFYDLNGTKITVVSPDFVQRAHAAGLAVWVWMDSKDEQNATFYQQLLDMGVDGLNVSRPAVLMQLLARRGDAWDPNAPPTTTTTTPTAPTSVTTTPSAPAPGAARPVPATPAYTG
jgi:glycerophosphoryl diester phosphodiesterase